MEWLKLIGVLLFVLLLFLISIGVPACIIYRMVKGVKNHGLATLKLVQEGKRTTGRIVREIMDTSGRRGRRVVVYEFSVEGKTFQGDVADRSLNIGDEIEIEYDPESPETNKPAEVIDEARRTAPRDVRKGAAD